MSNAEGETLPGNFKAFGLGQDLVIREKELLEPHKKREIGAFAVWTLSSAKPRFDVAMLRDNNLETYWQSDGPAPHTINIQFPRKVSVSEIAIYLDHSLDESYTPCQIGIKAGSTLLDLEDIKIWEFEEGKGWLSFLIPITMGRPVRANFFQIVVLANVQSGRDSHIRQVKIFGPQIGKGISGSTNFDAPELFMYSAIR